MISRERFLAGFHPCLDQLIDRDKVHAAAFRIAPRLALARAFLRTAATTAFWDGSLSPTISAYAAAGAGILLNASAALPSSSRNVSVSDIRMACNCSCGRLNRRRSVIACAGARINPCRSLMTVSAARNSTVFLSINSSRLRAS